MNDRPSTEPRLARRANELRLLQRASAEINATLEVGQILQAALDCMDEYFAFRYAALFLADADAPRAELVLSASRGEPTRRKRERVRMGSGTVGAAAAKREIVRLNFPARAVSDDDEPQIVGHMAVPMLTEDVLVGVLQVETVDSVVMRKDDESLAEVVANQVAVALQSARLHERLRRLNESLEARVRERTLELEASNRELRDTQAQLVQSGKMAALGQLAAGLAHEMNTPLGAISSNADVAARAFKVIREALALDASEEGQGSTSKLARALRAVEDTNRVTRQACDRVFTIFEALRSFAKLDEAELQWTDLRKGLDSAASMLEHVFAQRIAVERGYAAIPAVRCYAGEINQVLLIVLSNAAEAIEGEGRIDLQTRHRDQEVIVEIRDNGCGIDARHLERIFDPGFTTKGVGVGTGLSLAIAYRIMEKHAGRITVDSVAGEGTRVALHLPVDGGLQGGRG